MKSTRSTRRRSVLCRQRVAALVAVLPGARTRLTGAGHLSLEVRGRRFGRLHENLQGNGRIALSLKAPKGAGRRLVAYAPGTFHVPRNHDRSGWIGIWLDTPAPDWAEIAELIQNASALTGAGRRANHHQGNHQHTTS